jgi:hypothetical protein
VRALASVIATEMKGGIRAEADGKFQPENDERLGGSRHAVRRVKDTPGHSSMYVGGLSNTRDPQYGQNIAKWKQDEWVKHAAAVRAIYELQHHLYWYHIPWEHAEIGVDNVARALELERKRGDRARNRKRTPGLGLHAGYDLAGQEMTYVMSTEPSEGAEELPDVESALSLLELAFMDLGVGTYVGYSLRKHAIKHSKEWTADLPKTENQKNEAIGTMPDEWVKDGIEKFVHDYLDPQARIRGLTAHIEDQHAVDAIDAANLTAKVTVTADPADPDGAWWVLDCWKAVGVMLNKKCFEEWRVNRWRRSRRSA